MCNIEYLSNIPRQFSSTKNRPTFSSGLSLGRIWELYIPIGGYILHLLFHKYDISDLKIFGYIFWYLFHRGWHTYAYLPSNRKKNNKQGRQYPLYQLFRNYPPDGPGSSHDPYFRPFQNAPSFKISRLVYACNFSDFIFCSHSGASCIFTERRKNLEALIHAAYWSFCRGNWGRAHLFSLVIELRRAISRKQHTSKSYLEHTSNKCIPFTFRCFVAQIIIVYLHIQFLEIR